MDVVCFVSFFILIFFVLFYISEGDRIFLKLSKICLCIFIISWSYVISVNRVNIESIVTMDTIVITGQTIKFDKAMKVKKITSHIPYCSKALDEVSYIIGE